MPEEPPLFAYPDPPLSDGVVVLRRWAQDGLGCVEEAAEGSEERKETLRAVARAIGGTDHAYLSRMVTGKVAVNPQHAERIAIHFGLPADYFPEVPGSRGDRRDPAEPAPARLDLLQPDPEALSVSLT